VPSLEIRPLEPATWPDLERLFRTKSAYGGCWCMFFRESSSEFERKQGAPNRRALKALVEAGEPTGLLAYAGDEAVGWASVAPRSAYERLRRSPLLVGAHDEPGIWSLLCLYVAPAARRSGVTHTLVDAACDHARRRGADVLEALPRSSARGRSAAELYVGTRRLFAAHGFEQVRGKRSSGGRVVMRRKLG
jgi:GNAT superfamily N-acetyltransferase